MNNSKEQTGKEGKSAEFMTVSECEQLFRRTNNLDEVTNPSYIQLKALDMYANQFKQRIAELEATINRMTTYSESINIMTANRVIELETEVKLKNEALYQLYHISMTPTMTDQHGYEKMVRMGELSQQALSPDTDD